ncbi:MAG: hypothetical protein DYG94_07525 [Leptolyngbya sp. PLA3]|nr:MAG: hypothetical protein EDM82_06460 [Cyanobacteria bacterium CYA]MCE7968580.1 hypothetical protein [Leptolyngbya sp. PL-A3]
MFTCIIDPALERVQVGTMRFPLGVYPVEPIDPTQGYAVEFEAADGAEDGSDLEEWPDRYVYDIVISIDRLPTLLLQLLALMPPRVFPILDFIGHDEFREIDPYISYEQLGMDQLIDGTRQFEGFFYEDGMCGFGAMSEEPFFYLFVDEHKILTIRVEPDLKPKVDKLLESFELEQTTEPVGVDTVAHEHRSVLMIPQGSTSVLAAEEIVGHLRQEWRLTLNVDPESNVDDEGQELGVTAWRAVVRCDEEEDGTPRYREIYLWAGSLSQAETLAMSACEAPDPEGPEEDGAEWLEVAILALDRLGEDRLREALSGSGVDVGPAIRARTPRVIHAQWLAAS